MTLDPERYECPEHHIDLTDRVEEEVEELDTPPIIYGGGAASGNGDFEVSVTCPGAGGAGEHELICTGKRRA